MRLKAFLYYIYSIRIGGVGGNALISIISKLVESRHVHYTRLGASIVLKKNIGRYEA